METHFNFLPGAPPPTHQSTTHLSAFRLSPLPPLAFPRSAIAFSVSSAFVLCSGLLCTSSVKALIRPESVPDWIIFARKLDSEDEEEEVWKVRMSFWWRNEAFSVSEESWEAVGMSWGVEEGRRGGIAVCQRAVGVNVKDDLGLKVTLVGSWTVSTEADLEGASGAGAMFFLLGGGPECRLAFVALAFSFACDLEGFRVAGSCAPFTSTLRSFKYLDISLARSTCRSTREMRNSIKQSRERHGHRRRCQYLLVPSGRHFGLIWNGNWIQMVRWNAKSRLLPCGAWPLS
jgi:hypothetical protein